VSPLAGRLLCLAAAALSGCAPLRPPRGEAIPGRYVAARYAGAAGGRGYLLYVPSWYSPERPAPLVVVLRGRAQTPAGVVATGFSALAEREGFPVVYPRQRRLADLCGCSSSRAAPSR
jgi:poly(3-hydroxybutyrate) depolymerase